MVMDLSLMAFTIFGPLLILAWLWIPLLSSMLSWVILTSLTCYESCESCQLRKHSSTPFPKSVSNRALSPFILVHSDIFGDRVVINPFQNFNIL